MGFLGSIRKRLLLTVVCAVGMLLMLFAFNSYRQRSFIVYLPNYYEILGNGPNTFEMVKKRSNMFFSSQEHILGPNITRYAIIGETVVGEIGKMPEGSKKPGDTQGFFMVHTQNGSVKKGLSEKQYEELVKTEQGSDAFVLLHPLDFYENE